MGLLGRKEKKELSLKILLMNELIHVQTLSFAWLLPGPSLQSASALVASLNLLRSTGDVGIMEENRASVCLSNPSCYSHVEYSKHSFISAISPEIFS